MPVQATDNTAAKPTTASVAARTFLLPPRSCCSDRRWLFSFSVSPVTSEPVNDEMVQKILLFTLRERALGSPTDRPVQLCVKNLRCA